jgi:mono/diheme cytochrome c family protein
MIDAPPIGRLFGPNLTGGAGSRTVGFTPADWDRIVRHGVRRDGKPAVMPSDDFERMTDQELSDVIAYIQSHPAVDNEVPPRSFGPVGNIIVGGDPSWPPARNLTPHSTGLGGWTFAQFVAAMREARRPDGTILRAPMSTMPVYAQKMTDVELEALWTYLKSLPEVASRN